MKRALLTAITLTLGGMLAVPTTARADEKPIRALLIAGGCCHDYAHQPEVITKGFKQRTTNIEVVISYDPDKGTKHLNPIYEKEDWYKGFDVIIHDECTDSMKDPKMIERILKPHREGLPAVNLHCAMHCYRGEPFPKTTPWMEFTGMNTNHHNAQKPIEITFTDTENPIVKGMANWTTIQEELYHPEELLPTAHALANGHQNVRKETDAPVIWTNDYRGTRVFSTTLGHNTETVSDARYLDLVTRGLLWSLNKLDAEHLKKN